MMTRVAISVFAFAAMSFAAGPSMDDLFDDSVVHDIRLSTAPVSAWQTLRDNYLEDTYYAASFEWRGMVVEGAGIRSRGSGSRYGPKPGLKVDFGKFKSGQLFLGLKTLVLDNLVQDETMIKERIIMQMFRRIGIPAPREAHARLYVNGAYAGLYAIVEPVDKGFLMRNLGEDGGYLYDYEWIKEYQFEDLGDDWSSYSPIFTPDTHEKDPDYGPLVNLVRAVNYSSDGEFLRNVSAYLDVEQFLRYLAVETFVGEGDGILGDWGMNNFYLYRFSGSNFSILIPWDKDYTFRAGRSIWENMNRNVLTRRLMQVPAMREYYLRMLERCAAIAGGPDGWLETEVAREYQQIRTAAAADPNRPYQYGAFEAGVSELRRFAFDRAPAVNRDIASSRDNN